MFDRCEKSLRVYLIVILRSIFNIFNTWIKKISNVRNVRNISYNHYQMSFYSILKTLLEKILSLKKHQIEIPSNTL